MYGHFKNSLHAYPVVGMELEESEDGTKPKDKGILMETTSRALINHGIEKKEFPSPR